MQKITDLIKILDLEQLSDNVFKGQNYNAPWGRVFGGQVLAQSLLAAYNTVPKDRFAHSLHGYFILVGDLDIPVTYEVDTLRDGGSFSTRRVVAKQNGKAIFNMAASFQIEQKGIEHQITMPNLIAPENLITTEEQVEKVKDSHPKFYQRLKNVIPKVFEFRPVENIISKLTKNSLPHNHLWIRTSESVVVDKRIQQALLAYVSDYNILTTATLPHREELNKVNAFYASIDHAIWFHRDFDINEWLLYTIDSPSASNSRGFSRGSIFNKTGELIASVTQEGLIRQQFK